MERNEVVKKNAVEGRDLVNTENVRVPVVVKDVIEDAADQILQREGVLEDASHLFTGMFHHLVLNTLRLCSIRRCRQLDRFLLIL